MRSSSSYAACALSLNGVRALTASQLVRLLIRFLFCVSFFDASLVCAHGSGDFSWFTSLGFCENGQKNDPASRGDPVSDSSVTTAEHEAQFAKRTVQLSCEGFVEENTIVGETIDVESHAGLGLFVEGEVPVAYFALKFNRTPRHSVDAIIILQQLQKATAEGPTSWTIYVPAQEKPT
jgi:hypothetical protein